MLIVRIMLCSYSHTLTGQLMLCVPRNAAAWVVQECEATQGAEGIGPVGFGIRLA